MKPILKQVLIPTASAIAGGLIVLGGLKLSAGPSPKVADEYSAKQNLEVMRHGFDYLFNDDFLSQGDPFDQMRKMREQIERRTGNDKLASNPFDAWFSDKFGGGSVNDISKREDDGFVYYDIEVEDVNSTSVNAKVENGYITITGTTEKKNDSPQDAGQGISEQSLYQSTFNRTFPLPEHIDQNKMQMLPEKDKVILKFPKIKS